MMEHGVLRVSETAMADIEATKAIVRLRVDSENLVFGNAAMSASAELKTAVEKIKAVSETVEIETESVATESSSGVFGKNSTAVYIVKLTVDDLGQLGAILGICSEGKKISMRSVAWDYDDDDERLRLIKAAVKKAKHKAEQMMAVIGYRVVGIRSCSDSYKMPNVGEIILNQPGATPAAKKMRARSAVASSPVVNIGTQFRHKKEISATCTVEFLVEEVC
ncbi:MAG: SIMPL domain-containing protein [Cyanobacteria bacterium J06621_11]